MTAQSVDWNEERVAELARLWNEGHSAATIAGMMGLVSRNSVIGKVHRLKLAARPPRTGPAKNARKTTLRPVRRALQVGKMARIPNFPRTPLSLPEFRPEEPKSLDIALLDLEPRHCRFPHGDGPYVFCGHPKRGTNGPDNLAPYLSPYCDYHHGITNYIPVRRRRNEFDGRIKNRMRRKEK